MDAMAAAVRTSLREVAAAAPGAPAAAPGAPAAAPGAPAAPGTPGVLGLPSPVPPPKAHPADPNGGMSNTGRAS